MFFLSSFQVSHNVMEPLEALINCLTKERKLSHFYSTCRSAGETTSTDFTLKLVGVIFFIAFFQKDLVFSMRSGIGVSISIIMKRRVAVFTLVAIYVLKA